MTFNEYKKKVEYDLMNEINTTVGDYETFEDFMEDMKENFNNSQEITEEEAKDAVMDLFFDEDFLSALSDTTVDLTEELNNGPIAVDKLARELALDNLDKSSLEELEDLWKAQAREENEESAEVQDYE
jgi:hypothetical protein